MTLECATILPVPDVVAKATMHSKTARVREGPIGAQPPLDSHQVTVQSLLLSDARVTA